MSKRGVGEMDDRLVVFVGGCLLVHPFGVVLLNVATGKVSVDFGGA